MLYMVDQNKEADLHWIRNSVENQLGDNESLIDFAWNLFTGVREQKSVLDEKIASVAANWRIDRMAPTDRNILRLGLLEMTHMATPAAIVLDECIELAKLFGTENSPSFINGILDKFAPQNPSPM